MKVQFVILITLASFLGSACKEEAPKEPGPLARASVDKPTLTSSAPTGVAKPIETKPVQDKPETTLEETPKPDAEPDIAEPEAPHDPEPYLEADDGVSLQRLVTAPAVEAREPVAASASFAHHEEKIYAFLEVANASSEDKVLTVYFIAPSGKATGGVELSIPAEAPRWRTWAFTRHADEVGLWRVEVRSPSGMLLGALPFEVAPGC